MSLEQRFEGGVKRCQELQVVGDLSVMVDFSRLSGGGVKYCGLSRRFDMSKCAYIGGTDVVVNLEDDTRGVYKTCLKTNGEGS